MKSSTENVQSEVKEFAKEKDEITSVFLRDASATQARESKKSPARTASWNKQNKY